MANEDSRNNNVLGNALKIAAIGAVTVKGGRALIRNYDDLGRTFGKAGDNMSKGIDKVISLTDNANGSAGKIRQGLEKVQGELLDSKHKKLYEKGTSIINEGADGDVLKQMNSKTRNYEDVHKDFKGQSRSKKRDAIDKQKEFNKNASEINKKNKEANKAYEEAKAKASNNTKTEIENESQATKL